MSDLTKNSTAELLAEIKNGKFHTAHGQNVQQFERVVALSNELNRRVINAGLSPEHEGDGLDIEESICLKHPYEWEDGKSPAFNTKAGKKVKSRITIGISIKELHDLLGWMLIREGR